jgi:hypothetical protein
MLSWLSGVGVDHPMANLKKARQIVVELLDHDSLRVLDETASWLDSVTGTEGFALDHRFELIDLLDRGAKYHAGKIAQEYLDAPRLQKAYEGRLWNASFSLWKSLGAAYLHCIERYQSDARGGRAMRDRLPTVAGRALRSVAVQLKWLYLRYGHVEERIWRDLGYAYGFAEGQGIGTLRAAIYPGAHGESSARDEFAKALMLAMSAPDGLNPIGIQVAERVVAYYGSRFVVQTAPAVGCRFSFDLSMHRPPKRAPGAKPAIMMRHFGAGDALARLRKLRREIEDQQAWPDALQLGRKLDPGQLLPVLGHLEQYWADNPPMRGTPRNDLATRITVVPGFRSILRWIEVVSDSSSLEFSNPENAESWIVFNSSHGGYGAIVPAVRGDWLAIGALIGVRPETADICQVAVIRRLARDQYNQRRVGIQALGAMAFPVTLATAAKDGDAPSEHKAYPALLLSKKPDRNGEIHLLLRAGAYAASRPVEMQVHKRYLLAPVALKERGEDYDWASFRIVRQL